MFHGKQSCAAVRGERFTRNNLCEHPFGFFAGEAHSERAYTPSRHPEILLTLPFSVLIAVFAAILETSVLAELPLAGATIDLVLVCAAVATLVLGVENGLTIAFVGGLLVDMVIPDRPMGAATLAMLLALGLAFVVSRAIGQARRLVAVGLVLILTPVFHVLFTGVMVLVANSALSIDISRVLIAALLNAIVAIPIAGLFGAIERRFGPTERVDW